MSESEFTEFKNDQNSENFIILIQTIIGAFPLIEAGRAIRSYCTGLSRGPVSAVIVNAQACGNNEQNQTSPVIEINIITMTKPANSPDKPSPSDTPTHRSQDNGHKSVVHSADKKYTADEPHGGDIAKKHEKEEQPVGPGKKS